MKPIALCSSRVCTPEGIRPAAVVIKSHKISAVQTIESIDTSFEKHDYGDLVIAPGIIDAHVHINDPGTTWEGFETATKAAAAGGVTTVVDMPLNSIPVTTNVDALKRKRATARGRCWVNVGFYGGLVPGNKEEIQKLIRQGVLGIKAFLCHSGLEQFPNVSEEDLRQVLPILSAEKIPLLVHAELEDPNLPTPAAGNISYAAYLDSRPDEWEIRAIKMLIRLCEEFETPIHIVHLSTEKALLDIEAAKNRGIPITVETCPHYLYFASERIPDGETRCKCAPPIRSEMNRTRLCDAVWDGRIDTIGSDHSPCSPELKFIEDGCMNLAWGGISGLQLTLPVVWTAGLQFGWQPHDLCKWLSENPAKLIGYENSKGRLAKGFDADIVIWNPDAKFQVQASRLQHRHPITAYDGQILQGVVFQTYVGGTLAFDQGLIARQASGNLLQPALPKPDFTVPFRIEAEIATLINELSVLDATECLGKCCAATAWVDQMLAARPFEDNSEVLETAAEIWCGLDRDARLKAFAAHPQIGDVDSLREKYANTSDWANEEQADADTASEETIRRLARLNEDYVKKFGYIFIVCATGKSATEMLSILEARLPNQPESELQIASEEQLQITILRLRKLTS